jgi:hypothetical protein
MALHAGEIAAATGAVRCSHCGTAINVHKGDVIPRCPNGHVDFDERIEPRDAL